MNNPIPVKFRWLLIIVVGLTLSASLLWGVWHLEEITAPVRTTVVESEEGEDVFTVTVHKRESRDFIIYCNEELFQEAFQEFTKHLDIDTEPLVAPGGPMILAFANVEPPEELKPAYRTVVELLRYYSPRRIVLVAHSECIFYDSISAWQNNLEDVQEKQRKHLIAAKNAMGQWFPETQVDIYYADKDGETLKFHQVNDESVTLPY